MVFKLATTVGVELLYISRRSPLNSGVKVRRSRFFIEGSPHLFRSSVRDLNFSVQISVDTPTANESISKITDTLKIAQHEYRSNSSIDPWLEDYYQLSNRLAFLFLHILNDKLNLATWLVLVNFKGDETYIKTSKEEWLSHYQHVFETLDFKHDSKMLSNVCMVYLPGFGCKREIYNES